MNKKIDKKEERGKIKMRGDPQKRKMGKRKCVRREKKIEKRSKRKQKKKSDKEGKRKANKGRDKDKRWRWQREKVLQFDGLLSGCG